MQRDSRQSSPLLDNKPKPKDSQGGSKNPNGNAQKGNSETGEANSSRQNFTPAWTKDCLVRANACGHLTRKCKLLIDRAVKVKGQFKASYKGSNKKLFKKGYDPKPWNKEGAVLKNYSRKEVQMLLKRQEKRKQNTKERNMVQQSQFDNDIDIKSLMGDDLSNNNQLDTELDSMLIE